MHHLALAALLFAAPTPSAPPAPKPDLALAACDRVVGKGSSDVLVEGKPAARLGDGLCLVAVDGASNVLINGRPAVTVGARVQCLNGKVGVVSGGAASVYVNGKPQAGADAKVVGCD